ncbi:MAG: PilN domain-containing protein [Clostridiaceae bacterium]|nr:PilN domain-containing protein [Clostridiaceae bacterium]
MYDLNFLAAPVSKKKKSPAVPVLLIMALLVVLGVGSYYVWIKMQIGKTQDSINEVKAYITSGDVTAQLAKINTLGQKQQLLSAYQNNFDLIDLYLNDTRIINGKALDAIKNAAPAGVSYNAVTLNGTDLQIEAAVPDSQTAALLLHNLKELPILESADLLTLVHDEASGVSSTSIHCMLKDVIIK